VVLPSSVTAVIQFTFTPIVQVGSWDVRLETIALAIVILASLLVAGRIARRTPVDLARPPDDAGPTSDAPNHLRRDDLLFIAVAALPGAVAGGRIGYVLLHLDFYTANPAAVLDIGQGAFQLSLAVVGGTLTAAIVAGLLGGPVGRWMHALILPLLLALAGGKVAMVLGGDGQGMPWDGAWATAYLGPGPWGSLAPALPSHPSQAYEAIATGGVILVLMALAGAGAFRRKAGGAFLLGIAMWALARAVVAASWRDPAVLGPLCMDQVLSLAIAAGALVLLAIQGAALARRGREPVGPEAASSAVGAHEAAPDWPDPASRPRI
jgi:prolipoprotein diacylglyceryltransferase